MARLGLVPLDKEAYLVRPRQNGPRVLHPCQHKQEKQWSVNAWKRQNPDGLYNAPAESAEARRSSICIRMPDGSRGPKKRLASQNVQAWHGHASSGLNTLTALPALLVAACTAVVFLATTIICIFLLIRPLLKKLESLAVACESAAKEVEKASAEFALASVVINNDLPTTLESMERASLEFEELGQSLNGLTGVLRRTKPSVPRSGISGKGEGVSPQAENSDDEGVATAGEASAAVALTEMSAVEAIQASTINSMRKVANDVSALATALNPAMIAWRKRLGFITERFDMANKPEKLKELPAAEDERSVELQGDQSGATEPSSTHSSFEEGDSQEKSWDEEVQDLQDKVMSQAESGDVGHVAEELAKAATEVADVARASLSSSDEEQVSELGLSPKAHQEGADLLEKAAKAAEALTREAQKAAEVESKFKALKDIAPVTDDFQPLNLPVTRSPEELEGDMEDRRIAAQAVFTALANAEEAASAAAAASGALETALQKAEQQAGVSWWGWGGPSLFRSSPKKKQTDAVEAQEHDGMAYPCSRYIASKGAAQSEDMPASDSSSKASKI